MDAMNQFEGTTVMLVLFLLRFGLPILGLYGFSRLNPKIYDWLDCPDCEAQVKVST